MSGRGHGMSGASFGIIGTGKAECGAAYPNL